MDERVRHRQRMILSELANTSQKVCQMNSAVIVSENLNGSYSVEAIGESTGSVLELLAGAFLEIGQLSGCVGDREYQHILAHIALISSRIKRDED